MDFNDYFEGDEDILNNEKIKKLKETITRIIDNSAEVRRLMTDLGSDDMSPFLIVEVAIGFVNKYEKNTKNMFEDKLTELLKEYEPTWTKKDKDFLRSINIEIKEDEK